MAENENTIEPSESVHSQQSANEREVLFSKFAKLKKDLAETGSAIDSLNKEYSEKIGNLQHQKESLENALVHVKALLKFEGYDLDKTEDEPSSSKQIQEQVSVRDAAYELLRELHQPLHYKEIASRLIQRNVNIPGKNSQATLLSKISRDKRFKRTKKRGVYTLTSPSALTQPKHKRRRH